MSECVCRTFRVNFEIITVERFNLNFLSFECDINVYLFRIFVYFTGLHELCMMFQF